MKKQNVLNCAFHDWYPRFKHVTINSCIFEVPDEVLEYLLADGSVVLPKSSTDEITTSSQQEADSDEDQVDWDSADADAEAPDFPQFDATLKEAIKKLGGAIFPKLDWSSPKDASWVSFDNTLRCSNTGEMYLLLKSSDFITHDLTEPFKFCMDCTEGEKPSVKHHLVLRQWLHMSSSGEFRCFVRSHQLVGISQRHHNSVFPFIAAQKQELREDIQKFFAAKIRGKFTDENYVFDVYVQSPGEVLLLDFNPFGALTDPLLFTWEELSSEGTSTDKDLPEFRYTEGERHVPPNPYSMYAMPQDFVDLAHGTDPHKLADFLQMRKLQEGSDTDSSEENDTKTDAVSDTRCTGDTTADTSNTDSVGELDS